VLNSLWKLGQRLRERGVGKGLYLQAFVRALRPLEQPGARTAFVHTLRSVIDIHGQRVSAQDRLYLLHAMPTLIVWGERDNTIPIEHGIEAHRAAPGSRFETLPRAAHFPHIEDPDGLADALLDFLRTSGTAEIDDADWAHLLAKAPRGAPEQRPVPV